jgi:hypothetical protein
MWAQARTGWKRIERLLASLFLKLDQDWYFFYSPDHQTRAINLKKNLVLCFVLLRLGG